MFLFISLFLLGSSVTFCETGDIYNRSYDQSDDFSYRWSKGRAQFTPRWTPDGSHIVFDHAGRILLVDAYGSDLQTVSESSEPLHIYSPTTEIDFSPSLSSDGTKIAYTTLRYASGELNQHTYEIATQGIDGSSRRRITNNEWNDISPSWSPDGSRIAFISYRKEGSRVYTIASDGSDERSIAPEVESSSQPPVWSPDGTQLAFLAIESVPAEIPYLDYYHNVEPKSSIYQGHVVRYIAYTVRVDGSGLTKLEWTNDQNSSPRQRIGLDDVVLPEEIVSQPSWSPDGESLAFAAAFYGELPTLYSMRADGSDLRILFTPPEREGPFTNQFNQISNTSWDPDGTSVGFISTGAVPTGSDSQRFVSEAHIVDVHSGKLQASGEILARGFNNSSWYMAWSPDRTRIAVHTARESWDIAQSKDAGVVIFVIEADGSNKRVLVRNVEGRLVAASP